MHDHDVPVVTADKLYDKVSHYSWLDFGSFPGEDIHKALKARGWRWSSYRTQYMTNVRWPAYPQVDGRTIEYRDQGTCDYSAERAERLEQRAERHDAAATAAYERSNALVALIPLGQPILVGHHSERGHRAALDKSHRAMDKSVEESAIARDLHRRAEAAERHQQDRTNVGKLARRRDRLAAELRKYERDALTAPGVRSSVWDDRIAALKKEIAELQAAIDAAGGEPGLQKPGEAAPFKKGDYIKIGGFAGVVKSMGPKTVTVNTKVGAGAGRDWPLKLDRNRFQGVLATAEELAERQQ